MMFGLDPELVAEERYDFSWRHQEMRRRLDRGWDSSPRFSRFFGLCFKIGDRTQCSDWIVEIAVDSSKERCRKAKVGTLGIFQL